MRRDRFCRLVCSPYATRVTGKPEGLRSLDGTLQWRCNGRANDGDADMSPKGGAHEVAGVVYGRRGEGLNSAHLLVLHTHLLRFVQKMLHSVVALRL
mmetsp:Transcript_56337/g.125720  ORF Transcript_56337/g.125720 Transcript_56337/m.125720 type:complete len:97 (+) Transcript_56337:5187-5477(+)